MFDYVYCIAINKCSFALGEMVCVVFMLFIKIVDQKKTQKK